MYLQLLFFFSLPFLNLTEELQILRESELRLKQQNAESQRRERILARRLALKEQEMQDYTVSILWYDLHPPRRYSALLYNHTRHKLPSSKPPRHPDRPPYAQPCSIRPLTFSFKSSRPSCKRHVPVWRKPKTNCPPGNSRPTRTRENG